MPSANPFFQGNYLGQPTLTDGGASASVPYMHGGNVGGPIETRHRTNFSHSSSLDLQNHNYHDPAPPTEGVRNHGISVHPQVAATPYHFPANYASQSTLNPSRDGLEMGRRITRTKRKSELLIVDTTIMQVA
ncbi:hypothetical protein V6N11_020868 [Hibiscus sabdariffa]|uniref:Uncharacterized protein n=1 Tax=Hibiscus sabdariffa TaxID=183260 RepID=A0ABR2Q9P6_9ROSI